MKDPIFKPIIINKLEVKNRIYMPAMHLNMAKDFLVTDQIINFYAERAKGGAGMICVGYATVDEYSGSTLNIGAHKDEFIPGLKLLASAIKDNGARAFVQLNHAGRYNFSFFINGNQPVAPSAIASRMTNETPRALEKDEIAKIIDSFAKSAGRVKASGFDGVEILSGTGYLISEFLSPLTNKREDEYGGSLENRMRFGLEVAEAVRNEVGPDFPIIFRMNGNEFMPGGSTPSDLREYAKKLAATSVNALCINVGWHEARVPQIVTEVPRGVFSYLARRIRDIVDIPVIASHRINSPELARDLINDDMCDMVAMGRSLIADPCLPEKARSGQEDRIVHCIACGQGCFDNIFKLKAVECLCNPMAGHEGERKLEKTDKPGKVMIAGGGAGGMSAAIAAHDRGHEVILFEKTGKLGGQLHLAGTPPGREEFHELAKDLASQVRIRNIKVVLNQAVDKELIEAQKPDSLIIASGARPLTPPVPGADFSHVVQAWDVLDQTAQTGSKVVIVGGGAVGVETALFLAEKGTLSAEAVKFLLVNRAEEPEEIFQMATRGTKEIVLIEMLDKVGKDIGKTTRWGMLAHMKRSNITTMTATKALEITENGIKVELSDGKIEEIKADTIVLGAGSKVFNPLEEVAVTLEIPFKIAGDAVQVARALEAVHQGFEAGATI